MSEKYKNDRLASRTLDGEYLVNITMLNNGKPIFRKEVISPVAWKAVFGAKRLVRQLNSGKIKWTNLDNRTEV